MNQRPRRVCFVIDNLAAAGTELQLLRLLANLDRTRFQLWLCLLDGENQSSRDLEPRDIPVMRLGVRKLRSLKAISAAVRFARFLRRERIDVVQAYFIDSARFAIPLARLAGVETVLHVRNNCGYWLRKGMPSIEKRLLKWTTCTVTNSKAARREWIGRGIPENRLQVIENMLPPPATVFAPPFQNRVPVVGIVANLRPVKNLDGFLHMARHVIDAGIGARFRIAGEGPERSKLEALAGCLNLSERVTFEGSVQDIAEFLREIDVAVLCSQSESQSNAVLEYLAAGKAVLATDVGTNREWIERTGGGIVVPARSENELGYALVRLLKDRLATARMAFAGWQAYSSLWDEADPLPQWLRLYGISSDACSDATAPTIGTA